MEIRDKVIIEDQDIKSDNEVKVTSIKRTFNMPIKKINSISLGLLNRIEQFGEDDDAEAREKLHAIVKDLQAQDRAIGNADDFHNYVTELVRRDEYDLACDVLEVGMKAFPYNVDLLADFIKYGINCQRVEEVKHLQKVLLKIPKKRWTWRGFSFYVDYIQYLLEQPCSEKTMEKLGQEMLDIIKDYKKFFPYSEEPYITEAEMHKKSCEPDLEEDVLKIALDTVKVAPKCSLRYADILFDRGRYKEAQPIINRAKRDSTTTQASVSDGYIYYLSALCTIALVSEEEREYTKDEVEGIYNDFNLALKDFNRNQSFVKVIKSKTNMLVSKTNIHIDSEKYENLYNLVD